ncbi:hypothetical protein AAMO2058_001077100 [Amorphochlora amoebiformis]
MMPHRRRPAYPSSFTWRSRRRSMSGGIGMLTILLGVMSAMIPVAGGTEMYSIKIAGQGVDSRLRVDNRALPNHLSGYACTSLDGPYCRVTSPQGKKGSQQVQKLSNMLISSILKNFGGQKSKSTSEANKSNRKSNKKAALTPIKVEETPTADTGKIPKNPENLAKMPEKVGKNPERESSKPRDGEGNPPGAKGIEESLGSAEVGMQPDADSKGAEERGGGGGRLKGGAGDVVQGGVGDEEEEDDEEEGDSRKRRRLKKNVINIDISEEDRIDLEQIANQFRKALEGSQGAIMKTFRISENGEAVQMSEEELDRVLAQAEVGEAEVLDIHMDDIEAGNIDLKDILGIVRDKAKGSNQDDEDDDDDDGND